MSLEIQEVHTACEAVVPKKEIGFKLFDKEFTEKKQHRVGCTLYNELCCRISDLVTVADNPESLPDFVNAQDVVVEHDDDSVRIGEAIAIYGTLFYETPVRITKSGAKTLPGNLPACMCQNYSTRQGLPGAGSKTS